MSFSPEMLRVEALSRSYPLRRGAWGRVSGEIAAVDRVSFRIARGETLGLVGESGSGKTTTGRLVLRLEEPDAGRIWLEGEDWLALSGAALRRRRRDVQIVFQDPQTSLNPRMTCADQIAEPLRVQRMAARRELPDRVRELLGQVGLPGSVASRFPAELSGGQRQRVAIARALATHPRLVVCDEPVSSLDVSIAAQLVNLLLELQERNALSYLFISHDIGIVRRLANRIAVMYRGRIVEEGPASRVTEDPRHPYTVALLSAVRDPDPAAAGQRIRLAGDLTSPSARSGCVFWPRCPIARPRCREESPPEIPVDGDGGAACFYPGELQVTVDR